MVLNLREFDENYKNDRKNEVFAVGQGMKFLAGCGTESHGFK